MAASVTGDFTHLIFGIFNQVATTKRNHHNEHWISDERGGWAKKYNIPILKDESHVLSEE